MRARSRSSANIDFRARSVVAASELAPPMPEPGGIRLWRSNAVGRARPVARSTAACAASTELSFSDSFIPEIYELKKKREDGAKQKAQGGPGDPARRQHGERAQAEGGEEVQEGFAFVAILEIEEAEQEHRRRRCDGDGEHPPLHRIYCARSRMGSGAKRFRRGLAKFVTRAEAPEAS